jgi:hypothetical protein
MRQRLLAAVLTRELAVVAAVSRRQQQRQQKAPSMRRAAPSSGRWQGVTDSCHDCELSELSQREGH